MFRLWAPKAKDENGVWSVTLGPFEPSIYTYGFLIGGVRASDPACRCTLAWAGRMASSKFVVAASAPGPWDERTGAKGTLHYETYFSGQQQRLRKFLVYTPADYRSPIHGGIRSWLLLPGTPGDESDWTTGGGFADVIFDNLIAGKKMRPTIVVMHASDVLMNGRRAENLKEFEPLLVNELAPEIKSRYRVARDPNLWAIAGLSLGGELAMTVGLRHPKLFRSVASLSGSMVERDFEDRFGGVLAKPAGIIGQYRLIWIGCGAEDIFFGGNKALVKKLTSAGIDHRFVEFQGLHVMPVFRRQLVDLLPRLFQ